MENNVQNRFPIGMLIKNTVEGESFAARVRGYIPETGDLIVSGYGLGFSGEKWVADPDKCEPLEHFVKRPVTAHKNGLITFGA